MLKLLIEIAPLMVFFFSYKYWGILDATLYMLIFTIISTIISYLVEKKFHKFSLISSGILLVSGIATLVSGNTIFIKIKPTILYSIFSVSLFISALKDRPLAQYILGNVIVLDNKYWKILSYRFAVYFIIMAIINELVWRNCEEATWVSFKFLGALPITFLFILMQAPFLLKHKQPEE